MASPWRAHNNPVSIVARQSRRDRARIVNRVKGRCAHQDGPGRRYRRSIVREARIPPSVSRRYAHHATFADGILDHRSYQGILLTVAKGWKRRLCLYVDHHSPATRIL
ncbi:hypothetical protein HDF13_002211 [Edaphobacter lichenicola]|uniref:Uncharacterized protein n=1 Tax=Tunturiibacter gelidiferens TaxID=3069689 RepID=A0ACC5NZ47_9BACT|nr:hypothetical protein [Edaphobacter lichenicola]